MECDSVLGQQSISGKNVSLILCVWKPCYVKSGHIYIENLVQVDHITLCLRCCKDGRFRCLNLSEYDNG